MSLWVSYNFIRKGCDYISNIFDLKYQTELHILTLDYNKIGNDGLYFLQRGLKTAKSLTYLSLAYCNIDETGIKFLADIIPSSICSIKTLVLAGNPLKNAGLNILINALNSNTSVEELNLNNILFGNDEETIFNLTTLMTTNLSLLSYQVKYNLLTDTGKYYMTKLKGLKSFIAALSTDNGRFISKFDIDERFSKELFDEFYKLIKKGRKKKPKKKGGKGGKKGKGK